MPALDGDARAAARHSPHLRSEFMLWDPGNVSALSELRHVIQRGPTTSRYANDQAVSVDHRGRTLAETATVAVHAWPIPVRLSIHSR
jgi:hypothetical protein